MVVAAAVAAAVVAAARPAAMEEGCTSPRPSWLAQRAAALEREREWVPVRPLERRLVVSPPAGPVRVRVRKGRSSLDKM